MAEKTIKLIKFGGEFCAPCRAMDKAQTLEKFAAKYPEVHVIRVDTADKKGVPYLDGEKVAEAYGITALPTLVFERIGEVGELVRADGAHKLADIEELYAVAKKRLAVGALVSNVGTPDATHKQAEEE